MGIKCEDRTTQRQYTLCSFNAPSCSCSIGLEEGRQMSEKPQSHKYDLTSSPLPPPHPLHYPLQLFPVTANNAWRACTTSAVNDSVPPRVNFQFAQWRVTITYWPANCISPLIPYHFILGSLCSLNWSWLYLVVAICLLFSWCLNVQPDCIREREGVAGERHYLALVGALPVSPDPLKSC